MWVAEHMVLTNLVAEMLVQIVTNIGNLTGSIFCMTCPFKESN